MSSTKSEVEAKYGVEVTSQAESDAKYHCVGGRYVCRKCGGTVMAIDELQTASIHDWPEQCAGSGQVEVVKIQHPYCSACESELGDKMAVKYRR